MTATRAVTRFEADLLKLLRFLLGYLPDGDGQAILHRTVPAPAGLTPNAISLVQSTLRKGIVQFLVRGGGWREERHLHDRIPVAGHPWQRWPLGERQLAFTGNTLAFLIWLTAERPSEARQAWVSPGVPPTHADLLVLMLAARQLTAFPEQWQTLKRSSLFAANPLIWLAMPAELASDAEPQPPDFAPLFAPPGPAILECLQEWLTDRWVTADGAKAAISNWTRLRSCGRYEEASLAAFFRAAEVGDRRDLARFLLKAVRRRLQGTPDLNRWLAGLTDEFPVRLAERIATKRAALSMIRSVEVFDRWDREARSSRFYDSDFTAGQFWKAEYEAVDGAALLAKYRALISQIDPLTGAQ